VVLCQQPIPKAVVCRRQYDEIEECNKKLEHALNVGAVYSWDHRVIETALLDSAIATAKELEWNSPRGTHLLETATIICDVRIALKESDWPKVEIGLYAAKKLHLEHPELASARGKINFRNSVSHILEQLKPAIESLDLNMLHTLLSLADELKIGPDHKASLALASVTETIWHAREVYEKGHSIRVRLADALSSGDLDWVKAMLSEAAAFGLETPEVMEAWNWVQTMTSLNARFTGALLHGGMTDYNRDAIDVMSLLGVIADASSAPLGLDPGLTLTFRKAQAILRLRQALKSDDWVAAARAADDACLVDPTTVGVEVLYAQERLRHRQAVARCESQLMEGLSAVDEQQLADGLKEASRLRIRELAAQCSACAKALEPVDWAELMSERITTVLGRLAKAVEVQDTEALAALVLVADDMRLNNKAVESAKALLSRLRPLFESLVAALATGCADRWDTFHVDKAVIDTAILEAAIDAFVAEALNVEKPRKLVSEARAVLEVRRALCQDDMLAAREHLQQADRNGVSNQELETVRVALAIHAEALEANKSLRIAMQFGGVTDWRHEYIVVRKLEEALAASLKYDWRTPREDLLQSHAAVLRDLRQVRFSQTAQLAHGPCACSGRAFYSDDFYAGAD
jgi:hypothetical protein